MFHARIGNLFASQARTLVNTVNCVGVMGKGVAQEFKKRYPEMFADYVERCARKRVKPGEPYHYHDLAGVSIINFPTKDHWRSPSRLSEIERGLDYFAAHFREWEITGIAFPPLGCGNGGLSWADVGPLMHRKLSGLGIDVEVYAPYGTPLAQLGETFLARPGQMSFGEQGRKQERMNPEWVVLMEIIKQLDDQPYAPPVGRTIFQKICYVVTGMGVDTGFHFGKGSFGPYAEEVNQTLHDFANRNWMREQTLGRMVALRASPQYEKDRAKYAEVLEKHKKKITKAVDLFSRIKNTQQAEEVFTVLFACREIKRTKPDAEVSEQDIFDYILEWKQAWRKEEKKRAVADAIRSLLTLGWMKVSSSDSLTGGE
jgi:O-acetyl-ADP-ribose deacetylase (regulator of RNase III)/uncharacterized protein YwgA